MSRAMLLLLVCCALYMITPVATLGEAGRRPKKVALVARAYDNRQDDLPAHAVRRYSGADVRLVKSLGQLGWDVTFLESRPKIEDPPPADSVPTAANLATYLKGLSKKDTLDAGDEVLVVLVGHLLSLEDDKSDVRKCHLYFCPQDAAYQGLKNAGDVNAENHLIPLEKLYDYLNACPAERKLLVFITALSTTYKPDKFAAPLCATLPALPAPPEGVAVWVSCSRDECTVPRSRFLDFLKERLGSATAGDTFVNLVTDVNKDVIDKAATYKGSKFAFKQTPQLLGKLPAGWAVVPKDDAPARPLLVAPFTAAAAKERQGQLAKELKLPGPVVTNGAGIKLALVPPGEFRMGGAKGDPADEAPNGRVRVARPLLVGQHEVTQGQYQKVMGDNPSAFRKVAGQDTDTFPVEQVTVKQMILFCNALSEQEKLPPYYRLLTAQRDEKTGKVVDFLDYTPTRGSGYRLPTEAEWEYACRAGTTTAFHVGEALTGKQANVDANRPGGVKEGAYLGRPAPVGSYAPNAFGLYDMHGNVAEMCEDSYIADRFKGLGDGVVSADARGSGGGVARGGAWNFAPADCRSASRLAVPPQAGLKFVGFRVVRNAE